MIGYLEGIVFDVSEDAIILNVNGVGYEVLTTKQTLADSSVLLGQKISVWVYSHVREDAFQLFGFLTKPEKDFFMQLLKVNGVGPKSALTLMSGATLAHIQGWIEAGDAKALSALPKVGKKTSEQIILTLQGKLVMIDDGKKSKLSVASNIFKTETQRQIASALVNLGFKSQKVDEFIETLAGDVTLEDGVRKGLQKLSGQV